MSNAENPGDRGAPRPDPAHLSTEQQHFLRDLMDRLADQEPEALEELIAADPERVDQYAQADDLRDRLRAALTERAQEGGNPADQQIVRSIQAALAAQRQRATGDRTAEPPGILTSVTRQLPPEKAIELYRKITPVFVYQVLSRLDESTSLRVVHEIVDHLCSEPVQQRLQSCEHVRDGILEELRLVLGRSDIDRQITRETLHDVLEESGATNDLMAMENCIRLARSKAG